MDHFYSQVDEEIEIQCLQEDIKTQDNDIALLEKLIGGIPINYVVYILLFYVLFLLNTL